jgi:HlyD family secretion protein
MNRRAIVIVVLSVLVGAAAWWWIAHTPRNGPLTLTGNVEIRQVNLGFKVGGRIMQLRSDEGDTVSAGQSLGTLENVYFQDSIAQLQAQRDQARAVLAKLEAGNRPEEIAQAEATVAERESTLINANVTLERAETLLKSAAGSRKTYDDAVAAQRVAEAQLNVARQALQLMRAGSRVEDIAGARAQLADREAALQVAMRQLADSDLVAPSKGVVLSRVREVGSIVAAGETVFVLSLTDPVWVRSYVSELDLGRIHPGQQVSITIDTPGTAPLQGRVGFISTAAEFTPKNVETRELRTSLVYRIRIVVADPNGILRQGMPVTISGFDAGPSRVSDRAP